MIQIERRLDRLIPLINLLGAVLTFLYFNLIDPLPRAGAALSRLEPDDPGLFLLAVAVTFTTVTLWRRDHHRRINAWVRRLSEGAPAVEVPEGVRRAVLEVPVFTAASSGIMWVLVGVFFAWLAHSARQFVGVTLVGGIFTTALLYLVVDLLWRPVIPLFFPEGQVSATRAFRLPVFGRLLLVFLLVGLHPPVIMMGLTWGRARALVSAANPGPVLTNLLILQVFILLVSFVASVSLAVLVTTSLTGPLKALQQAMAQVAQSDLSARAPVTVNDELGYLAERFNAMVEGLRQGERLRGLFSRYVSPEVARRAVESGAGLGGELATCTILFSDLRGFTRLSEQMPPEPLVALINRYMTRMVRVISAGGGIVTRFGGDAIMGVFGSPLNPSEEHAAQAVRAALEMRRELADFNREQAAAGRPALAMGIGIATGPVVAGNIGGHERIEYTVMGEAVNLASRLQDLTKELEAPVLISEATYQGTRPWLEGRARVLPEVAIRGKQEQVTVYALDEVRYHEDRYQDWDTDKHG